MNGLISTSKSALDAVLNLIYPPICQICRQSRAAAGSGYVCSDCFEGANGVRFICPPFCGRCGLPFEGEFPAPFRCENCDGLRLHFTAARSAAVAKNLVLDVIHRYKYQGHLWFEPFLAGLLEQAARPWLVPGRWDMVIPVPLHSAKRRERGFNQAERLAAAFQSFSDIPMNAKSLFRVKTTQTQTRLSQVERAANVHAAFRCDRTPVLQGRRVVLIDDVMTTGATTNACAKALLGAGAAEVFVWTVARGV